MKLDLINHNVVLKLYLQIFMQLEFFNVKRLQLNSKAQDFDEKAGE